MPGLVKRLALAAPAPTRLQQRRLRIPLRRPELFTDIAAAGKTFIAHDPLALRTITWRFAAEDRKLTRYAREAAPFLHLPTLLDARRAAIASSTTAAPATTLAGFRATAKR